MSNKLFIENKILDYFRQNEFLSISPSLNYNLLSKDHPKSQTDNKEHIRVENIIQKEIRRYINIKNNTDDQFSTLYNKVKYESIREINKEDKINNKGISKEVSDIDIDIDLNEKYKLIKNKFSELKHILLSDKSLRHSFFKYLSKDNTHFISFYKFIFNLILDQELSKKDLYHRLDKKVLSLIKMEDFSNDINEFLRNISKKPTFNNNF